MATSRRSAGLLIRLDPRARGGLQRQIYASVQRAILDGVVGPGTRLPSSRALADDLGVSRTTTLLAVQQLHDEGYLTARRGSGTYVAHELPDDLPSRRGSRPGPRRLKHPTLSRRGATLVAAPQGARRLRGPPRAFCIGTPGVDLFPVGLWWRLASRRLRSITATQLDYGEPAGLRALREAIAEHVQAARGTRCRAEQILIVAGAQQGMELISRVLLDPGDRCGWRSPATRGRAARCWARGPASSRCGSTPRGSTSRWAPAGPVTRGSSTSRRRISTRSASR
jgi:GntR family transcriptional regulator/MocR family aminotransferase